MGTGSFPGVKRPGLGVGQALPYSAEVNERVGLSTPLLGLCSLLEGKLYFDLYLYR